MCVYIYICNNSNNNNNNDNNDDYSTIAFHITARREALLALLPLWSCCGRTA